MGDKVIINEVGLRDGLQNQPTPVDTAAKLRMLDALIEAGLRHFEVTSFVNPKAVPQMADAAELFAALPQRDDLHYSALVANLRGCERARDVGVQHLACVLSVTDTFSRRNINMTLEQATDACEAMIRFGQDHGMAVSAYVSAAFGCPYEGDVDPAEVERLTARMLDAGAAEVIVADTIGSANPFAVGALIGKLVETHGAERLSVHFHDTKGLALANNYASYLCGIRRFDASVGGLGGCPFAPGAKGNVATEDLVHMFEAGGCETGIDLDRLAMAVVPAERAVGQKLGSRWLDWYRGKQERLKA